MPKLQEYISSITPPYNNIEFVRLGIPEQAEFLDPITATVMNFPVTLHGKNFDFYTLDTIEVDPKTGKKHNPFDRAPFILEDIKPNSELLAKIQAVISKAKAEIASSLNDLFEYAKTGNTAALKDFLDQNEGAVGINALDDKGNTALHYACTIAAEDTINILIDYFADFDLPNADNKTPHDLLKAENPLLAEKIKLNFVNDMKSRVEDQCKISLFNYAMLLLNGRIVPKDVPAALQILKQAGDLGDEEASLFLTDIYAYGMYDVNIDLELAKKHVTDSLKKHDSVSSKLKHMVIYHLLSKQLILLMEINELFELADTANPEAQYICGILLEHGIYKHISKDPIDVTSAIESAVASAASSATENSAPRTYEEIALSIIFAASAQNFMTEVSPNMHRSLKYMKQAAEADFLPAIVSYAGFVFNNQSSSPAAKDESLKFLAKAADKKYIPAMHMYGIYLQQEQELEKAFGYFKYGAIRNHVPSMTNYALCLQNGTGVASDENEALKFLKVAADKEYLPAQYYYAFVCFEKPGLIEESETYFKKLFDNRVEYDQHPYLVKYAHFMYGRISLLKDAGTNLSFLPSSNSFLRFSSTERSPRLVGLEHIKTAADMGLDLAQFFYAECFFNGIGGPKNIEEAKSYYARAAEQGHAEAAVKLKRNYHSDLEKVKNAMKQAMYNCGSEELYIAMLEAIKGYHSKFMKIENLGSAFSSSMNAVLNDRSPSKSSVRQIILDMTSNPAFCTVPPIKSCENLIQIILGGDADALNSTRAFFNTFMKVTQTTKHRYVF